MATDVTMPRLSDSMEEGTILKWIVEEGGEVKRGEPLCEIETDKANMTYEADTDGVLIEIVVPEGETVELGEVIARIGEPGEAGASGDSGSEASEQDESGDGDEEEEAAAEEEPADEPEPEPATASGNGSGDGEGDERAKASPVARRVANELGIDIADVQGTGPGGRILKADVEKAADEDGGAPEKEEAPPPKQEKKKDKKPKKEKKKKAAAEDGKPASDEQPEKPAPAGDAGNRGELKVQELTRLQRTVSRRMAESKATAPDFTLEVEIDMTLCVELRERLKQVEGKPPSFNDMVVKACANALRDHPRANAAYRDGKFELYSRVNVGVAVAANDALVVPTVFDADKKSLGEISRTVRDLANKVREGT